MIAKIALQPILALAAVVYAVKIRAWPRAGDSAIVTLHTLYLIVLAPLLAVAVAALEVRNQRPGLATVLAVLPTVVGVLGVLAFAIGVSIHGF